MTETSTPTTPHIEDADRDTITRYIDDWLAGNRHQVSSRVVDFALDVRLLVATGELTDIVAQVESEIDEPVPA